MSSPATPHGPSTAIRPASKCLTATSMDQVAVWHGSADPDSVGDIALALAYWYGPDTILNTEVQGGGKTVLNHWRDANYPHIWMDRRPDRPKKLMQAYRVEQHL